MAATDNTKPEPFSLIEREKMVSSLSIEPRTRQLVAKHLKQLRNFDNSEVRKRVDLRFHSSKLSL